MSRRDCPALIRTVIDAVVRIVTYPVVISYRLKSMPLDERKAILGTTQLMSLLPGHLGILARAAVYSSVLNRFGEGTTVSFGVVFTTSRVSIGKNVYIGPFCEIGQSEILDNVLIGSHVCILSGLRQHGTHTGNEETRGQARFDTITIGEDSWIGTGCIIGANVGRNCVIGTGSVVVHDIQNNCVAVGNPASVIRSRAQSEEIGATQRP